MTSLLMRTIVSVAVIVAASELARRNPRLGGFVLSLPLVSILAMVMSWLRDHDITAPSQLARETVVFVALGLPFFLPLACAQHLGLGFWTALTAGVFAAAATTAVGLYLLS